MSYLSIHIRVFHKCICKNWRYVHEDKYLGILVGTASQVSFKKVLYRIRRYSNQWEFITAQQTYCLQKIKFNVTYLLAVLKFQYKFMCINI